MVLGGAGGEVGPGRFPGIGGDGPGRVGVVVNVADFGIAVYFRFGLSEAGRSLPVVRLQFDRKQLPVNRPPIEIVKALLVIAIDRSIRLVFGALLHKLLLHIYLYARGAPTDIADPVRRDQHLAPW